MMVNFCWYINSWKEITVDNLIRFLEIFNVFVENTGVQAFKVLHRLLWITLYTIFLDLWKDAEMLKISSIMGCEKSRIVRLFKFT